MGKQRATMAKIWEITLQKIQSQSSINQILKKTVSGR
jgi:hypothetical protein